MNRRTFLASSVALAASAITPRFSLAQSDDGVFQLTAGTGEKVLYKQYGNASKLWLYNDSLPGPVIRARKGEKVMVNFSNNLDEPTSVHWHGIRIDNAYDGVAGLTQDAVQPGESFPYEFTVPDAGTYWYHAHDRSWNQVPRGLAGPLIISEADEAFAPDRDITLMLTDWLLDEEGRFETETLGSPMDFSHGGRHGNWLTVNGIDQPEIRVVPQQWHRLRLINASTARVLEIDPARFGARLIGYDGQVFDAPRDERLIELAPAQRADFVMMGKAGNTPFELINGEPFQFATFTGGEGIVSDMMERPAPMPEKNALPEPDMDNATPFKLVLTGGAMGRMETLVYKGEELQGRAMMAAGQFWGMNGIAGMSEKPMFSAKQGETLLIETENQTAWPHGIHLHGHHFQVLELNGKTVDTRDWRDTFLVGRGENAKIALVADNPGKWLLHCHMLGHAASGMNNWFEVV